jgi:hypothetical protein
MTPKHTPGPWEVSDIDIHGRCIIARNPRGMAITVGHANNSTILPSVENAQLIAAAPELLEALKALMERSSNDAEKYAPNGNEPIWAFIQDAADAISKAQGE